jgi:pimeloyl-ACP methyl ester carboxylesterase
VIPCQYPLTRIAGLPRSASPYKKNRRNRRRTGTRGEYTINGFAAALWSLLDHLQVSRANIIGFSLGGAVALEMAAQRPASVPRLGLINSLATYRPDDWNKWLETYVTATLVRLVGMRRAAWLLAARLFPEPWQHAMRKHAAAVVGAVPASAYLSMGWRWHAGRFSIGSTD